MDIERLVDTFYASVLEDRLLAPMFADLDWDVHKPIMYRFWSSMMFGGGSYQGNPLQKHLHLPLRRDHFAAWLKLFEQTVDQNFVGEKAEEIKVRAQHIARLFQYKLGLMQAS
jgi:hemoglobin